MSLSLGFELKPSIYTSSFWHRNKMFILLWAVTILSFSVPAASSTSTTSPSSPTDKGQIGIYTWRPHHDNTIVIKTFTSIQPWFQGSLMRCILECSTRVVDCNAVLYHTTQQMCQAGFAIFRPQTTSYASVVSKNGNNNGGRGTAGGGNVVAGPVEVIHSKTLRVCDANLGYTLWHNPGIVSCVQTFPMQHDYDAASTICRQNGGGRLFSLRDRERFKHIPGISSSVYVGLVKTSGGYQWSDGTIYKPGSQAWKDLWAVGEPGSSSSANCVILARDYRMYTVDCGRPYGFICELPVV